MLIAIGERRLRKEIGLLSRKCILSGNGVNSNMGALEAFVVGANPASQTLCIFGTILSLNRKRLNDSLGR